MITLKHKRRCMRVFNLDAPFFVSNQNETPFGQPTSITFLALEERPGLPDEILGCSEIQAAIRAGDIRLLKQPPVAKETAPEPTVYAEDGSEN